MDLVQSTFKNSELVKISGRIDSNTAAELESMLKAIQDKGQNNIVLDIQDVEFMSSRGFWVLVEAQKRAKKGGKGQLLLAAVPDKIIESLELVGMSKYFKNYQDVISAVGSF